jgi:hypothetical protein
MKDNIQILHDWLDPKKNKVEIAHAYHKTKIEELKNQIDRTLLRGKRKATRFFVENEFITDGYMEKLPKLCTLVYCAILKHGNTETQVAWPSLTTIQHLTGEKNRNYVSNAVRLLVECNILGVVQTKKGFKTLNLYYFTSVQYWKQFEAPKGRLKLTAQIAQYPNQPLRSIRKGRNRSINVDTLTNQNNKSPNSLTSIGDVLKAKAHKWQIPPSVAIQEGSGHSVVQSAYEREAPWRQTKRDHQEGADVPVIAGNLREVGSIQSDTTKPPFKNGEKWVESADQTHTGLSLDDITQEDLGPGTATL